MVHDDSRFICWVNGCLSLVTDALVLVDRWILFISGGFIHDASSQLPCFRMVEAMDSSSGLMGILLVLPAAAC